MSSECRKDLRQLLPFVTKSMYLNACWGTRITVGYKALIDGDSNLSTDTFWENLSVSVPVGWVVCEKNWFIWLTAWEAQGYQSHQLW